MGGTKEVKGPLDFALGEKKIDNFPGAPGAPLKMAIFGGFPLGMPKKFWMFLTNLIFLLKSYNGLIRWEMT